MSDEKQETIADIVAMLRANARGERCDEFSFTSLADRIEAAAQREISTPATGMPSKRDVDEGAHPKSTESCAGTGRVEYFQTVQIGKEKSGGGRAEVKLCTPTAGGDPVPAKSISSVGNAAAMREALVSCMDYFKRIDHPMNDYMRGLFKTAYDKTTAALSAPARNCDLFVDAEDARRAWLLDAGNWDGFGSPKLELNEWLLAPAAERKGGRDE